MIQNKVIKIFKILNKKVLNETNKISNKELSKLHDFFLQRYRFKAKS